MEPADEGEVLRLLETALEMPPRQRQAWLDTLDARPAVTARLRHLLRETQLTESFLGEAADFSPLSADRLELPAVGDRLGIWRLERGLGSGGMSVVFLARRDDGIYQQQVAIKLMRGAFLLLEPAARAALTAHFENERHLLARLEHPNIARILDGGSTRNGLPWLAVEFIDGQPLDAYCASKDLDLDGRLRLFVKLCHAVQAAHQHLIVHGDLKPNNVLVDAQGEPKLLDFGIARSLEADGTGKTARARDAIMTPAYASPEQFRLQALTTSSDVYSLGVMLYELISGGRPYVLVGTDPDLAAQVITRAQPISLRRGPATPNAPDRRRPAHAKAVDPDLECIVAKALDLDPGRRYGSAEGMADDLQRHLTGWPVLAHADSISYRARKFLRRHRFGSVAASLALAAVLGAAGVAVVQARQAQRSALDTEQVNAFLLEVLNASSPYESGTELTLGQALDDAIGKIDAHFGHRPDLAVAVRNSLAESLFARGRLDNAEKVAQRARDDATRLFGSDDKRTVMALATLANVRKEQERDDEAMNLFGDAMRRLERSGQTSIPLYADLLNDLGVLHLVREEFDQAKPLFERALALDRKLAGRESREEHARTLGNLAHAERGLGHLDRADALYRQAQPILEALYPDGGPHLAVILNNRAKLAHMRGDDALSFDLQKQAVAMHRASFHGDHAMVLVPLTNLAASALEVGQVDLAASTAEDAVAMAARLYPGGHAYRLNAILRLAAVRMAQGRSADAGALLAEGRRMFAGLENTPPSIRARLEALEAQYASSKASAPAKLPHAASH